jgi:hypothetical protein
MTRRARGGWQNAVAFSIIFWSVHAIAAIIFATVDRKDGVLSAGLTALVYLSIPCYVGVLMIAGVLRLNRAVRSTTSSVGQLSRTWIALLLPVPFSLVVSVPAFFYLIIVELAVGALASLAYKRTLSRSRDEVRPHHVA